MAIKKVVFNVTAKARLGFGNVSFYTKKDGEWAKYDEGNKISNYETANVVITAPKYVRANILKEFTFGDTSSQAYAPTDIVIEFKNPIDVLNKITYCTYASPDGWAWQSVINYVRIYDEDEDLLFESTTDAPESTKDNEIVTILTP